MSAKLTIPHIETEVIQDQLNEILEQKGTRDEVYQSALAYTQTKSREEGIDSALNCSHSTSRSKSFDCLLMCDRRGAGQQMAAQAGLNYIAKEMANFMLILNRIPDHYNTDRLR